MVLLILNNTINLIWKEKNKNLVKQTKITTQQTKTLENPHIVDINSVNIEHPKVSSELSKTLRQAEKVSQVSDPGKILITLDIVKKKKWNLFGWKQRNNNKAISCF